MKQRILVLYYSQSGQLRDIIDNITADISTRADIDYAQIEPVVSYPLPWKASKFFDTMPETVQHIPIALKPLPAEVMNKDYDLVIFPNSQHGYGSFSPYMMRRRWDYFVKNLLGATPPHEYQLKSKPDPRNAVR